MSGPAPAVVWSRTTPGLAGGPDLVLLHGLGAASSVFDPLVEVSLRRWPGRTIVIDLPGHGQSDPLPGYSVGALAAAVAPAIEAPTASILIGHSLGGAVALALGSGWFTAVPIAVLALGIKCIWSAEDVERGAEVAHRPAKTFDTEAEARLFYFKVAGLPPNSAAALAVGAVRQVGAGWQLSQDPGTNAAGAPRIHGLTAASLCQYRLACGESDRLSTVDVLGLFDAEAVAIAGAGHNAHVDQPSAVIDLARQFLNDGRPQQEAAG